jgi:hypothetical protein
LRISVDKKQINRKLGAAEKPVLLSTGDQFQLYISSPAKDPNNRTEIGIRMKTGNFNSKSNYVAVLVEDEMLRVIIKDLTARLEKAH